MSTEPRIYYSAHVHTTGGRNGGTSLSDDGRLSVKHTLPGVPGNGTNPEQLFAAGWSACFEGALLSVARQMKVRLPPEMAIDAQMDLLLGDDGYSLRARFDISMPGVARDVGLKLIEGAEQTCPYSKATRGNIVATMNLLS
jgi:osmotically inducible protein OsmC